MRGWIVLLAFAAVGALKWMAEHEGDVPPAPRVVTEHWGALGDEPSKGTPAAWTEENAVEDTAPAGSDPERRPAESPAFEAEADTATTPAGGEPSVDAEPHESREEPLAQADSVASREEPLADVDPAETHESTVSPSLPASPPLTLEERAVLIRRLLDVYQRVRAAS